MADLEPVISIGEYRLVNFRSLTTGRTGWLVYQRLQHDPLAEFATLAAARAAVKRYQQADARRAG